MRGLLGGVVLVAGLAGLGFWAKDHQAPRIESRIAAAASAAILPTTHEVTTRVSGRDIAVTGTADTEAERDRILTALDAVPGRRRVSDGLSVLPTAHPFMLSLSKEAGKIDLGASGNVPTEAARADLAARIGGDASQLTLASGAPKDWPELARAAIDALGSLNFGQAVLTDDKVKIVGQAQTPAEAGAARAALANLPDGTASAELSLVDDGTPIVWQLSYTPATGARLTGKLPRGLDGKQIAAALGLATLKDEAQHAHVGPEVGIGGLPALGPWLPVLESLTVTGAPDRLQIIAGLGTGSDLDLTGQAMAEDLAATGARDARLRIELHPEDGMDGTHRRNAATGVEEVLSQGYWLPYTSFAPTLATCAAASDKALAAGGIAFLMGSDRFEVHARPAIDRLAAALLPCTRGTGFKALIGSHSDAAGDPQLMLGLSQRRATALRLALIARGVPGPQLRALGYGASRPIASEDSEAGKAANRRLTVEWSG